MKLQELKYLLEKTERQFVFENEIQRDAISPALVFKNPRDRELSAFMCALFAYGNVKQIQRSLHRLFERMDMKPVDFLINTPEESIRQASQGWFHRFNDETDLWHLWRILKMGLTKKPNLQEWFELTPKLSAFQMIEKIVDQIETTSHRLCLHPNKSFWYLFPRPSKGSACKRLNLFLRWMIGTTPMDLSLWKNFKTKSLIIPLDTHLMKQARRLKLCPFKNPSWKAAEYITNQLRKLDPNNPCRFDFALCHLGMKGRYLSLAKKRGPK